MDINSLGLRGPEITRTPRPGTRRILALGDSMTFGYYLEEGETWPARLEARLRDAGLDVELANGASGGWSIVSEASFLRERGLALEPDLVLIGFCGNDIEDLERSVTVYEGQKAGTRAGRGTLNELLDATALNELSLRWRIWWKGYRLRREGRVPHPLTSNDVPPERAEALWQLYGEWLDHVLETLAPGGTPLAIVYIPDAWRLERGLPATDETHLRALARARGIGFVSPLARFEGEPLGLLYHVPLDAHLAPEGARRVALAVAEMLLADPARWGGLDAARASGHDG